MKKMMKLALLALVGLLAAGNVMAADLTVQATVDTTCSITAGTLDFGTLDPTSGSDAQVIANAATVICTAGTPYTINQSSASGYNLSDGTNTIPYTLAITPPGAGTGAAQNVEFTGDILFADYQTKPAGTYTDTVVLTVTP